MADLVWCCKCNNGHEDHDVVCMPCHTAVVEAKERKAKKISQYLEDRIIKAMDDLDIPSRYESFGSVEEFIADLDKRISTLAQPAHTADMSAMDARIKELEAKPALSDVQLERAACQREIARLTSENGKLKAVVEAVKILATKRMGTSEPENYYDAPENYNADDAANISYDRAQWYMAKEVLAALTGEVTDAEKE